MDTDRMPRAASAEPTPTTTVNGVRLSYELSGTGRSLSFWCMDHGSPAGRGIRSCPNWQSRFAFSPMTVAGIMRASRRADRAASAKMSAILPP